MIQEVLADSDIAYVQHLHDFLKAQNEILVTKVAYDGDGFHKGLTRATLPDVAIVHLMLPLQPGTVMASYFRTFNYKTKSVLLRSDLMQPWRMKPLKRARAIIDKDVPFLSVVKAIISAHDNKIKAYIKIYPWYQKTIGNWLGVNLLKVANIFRAKKRDIYQ